MAEILGSASSVIASCKSVYALACSYQHLPATLRDLVTQLDDLIRTLEEFARLGVSQSGDYALLARPLLHCQDSSERLQEIITKCTKHSSRTGQRSFRDWTSYQHYEAEIIELKERLASYRLTLLTAMDLCQLQAQVAAAEDSATARATLLRLERNVERCTEAVNRWSRAAGLGSGADSRSYGSRSRQEAMRCLNIVANLLQAAEVHCKELQDSSEANNTDATMGLPTQKAINGCEEVSRRLHSLQTELEKDIVELEEDVETGSNWNTVAAGSVADVEEFLDRARVRGAQLRQQLFDFRDVTAGADGEQYILVTEKYSSMRARQVHAGDRTRQVLGQVPPTAVEAFAQRGPVVLSTQGYMDHARDDASAESEAGAQANGQEDGHEKNDARFAQDYGSGRRL